MGHEGVARGGAAVMNERRVRSLLDAGVRGSDGDVPKLEYRLCVDSLHPNVAPCGVEMSSQKQNAILLLGSTATCTVV